MADLEHERAGDPADRPGDAVSAQYEAYPYPARDPADEAKRLVVGSPSHPVEIDHFVYGGRRDWAAPFRVLVAGGGTGDALIMLATLLARRGTPAEIHYVDLSRASRAIAEARAAARGLDNIVFHTRDLMSVPDLGAFDYIDCCGVLHHLSDPLAGFQALAAALAPSGGLGAMVYAPLGRSGVYALQTALATLTEGDPPPRKLALARAVLDGAPPTHPFARNVLVGDHLRDDAGLYDLLLHARDTPFGVPRLLATLDAAGLELLDWVEPARYAPETYLPDPELKRRAASIDPAARAALAEQLAGNFKTHRFYARRKDGSARAAPASDPSLTPVLHFLPARELAATVAKTRQITVNVDGLRLQFDVDPKHVRLLTYIDGRNRLDQIAAKAGLNWFEAAAIFGNFYRALGGFNHLRFSHFSQR